jgi:hypothetical protein
MSLSPELAVAPPVPALAIAALWAVLVFGPRIQESETWRWTVACLGVLCLLPWLVGVEVWDRVRDR